MQGNINNLKFIRSTEEARRIGFLGGKASGNVRKRNKELKDRLKVYLLADYDITQDNTLDGYTAISMSLIKEAMKGNVHAFNSIRDLLGEKSSNKSEKNIKKLIKIDLGNAEKYSK